MLVSARPGSKGVEEPLEGILEPAPHAVIAGRDSETLEQAGTDERNGNGTGKEAVAVSDREPDTLEPVKNGNGNGKETVAVPDRGQTPSSP